MVPVARVVENCGLGNTFGHDSNFAGSEPFYQHCKIYPLAATLFNDLARMAN